jgi:hypothetical protein
VLISYLIYLGLLITLSGVILIIRPDERLRITTRRRASIVLAAGLAMVFGCLALPTAETSPHTLRTRLDEFIPAWQFREYHTLKIDASPERVYQAIQTVKADEIFLFKTLTFIRRAGRSTRQNILNPGNTEPVIEAAVRGGFARLADNAPQEVVIGTVVVAPSGVEGEVTPDMFRRKLPPGFAVAAMNFLVTPLETGGTLLSTETRVFANNAGSRRMFAAYWRMIYPGSVIIRRSWLRAIAKRATRPVSAAASAAP